MDGRKRCINASVDEKLFIRFQENRKRRFSKTHSCGWTGPKSRNSGALSICMEKLVVLVGQQMEHWKFFGIKGIALEVVLFSHYYRNDRIITEPFAPSYSQTMLIGEMRGSFPKITSEENRSI